MTATVLMRTACLGAGLVEGHDFSRAVRVLIRTGFSRCGSARLHSREVSMSIPIDDLGSTQRMGLGVVYSANSIKELIDLAVGHH